MKASERGFAMIEFLATLVFSIAALTVMLIATYASFSRLWLDRAAYEASICLSTSTATFNCEKALRETTARTLPIGEIKDLTLRRSASEVETKFRWVLNSSFFIRIEDVRALPLLGPRPKVTL